MAAAYHKSASNQNAHSMEKPTHRASLFNHTYNTNAKGTYLELSLPSPNNKEIGKKKKRIDAGFLKLMPHN